MGRKKKNSRTHFYLPPELYAEVLSRLPAKSLLRFRSVCKTWRSLIDGPHFVSMHLTNFKNNCNQSHLLVLGDHGHNLKLRCIIRRSDTFRHSAELEFPPGSYSVVGYINGLLPLMKLEFFLGAWKFHSLILWNPSIRKCSRPPPPPFSHMNKITFIASGFGVDPISNEYKVVLIVYPAKTMYDAKIPVLVEVYSVRTGSWKSLSFNVPCFRCVDPAVCVSGAIHWLGRDMKIEPWLWKNSCLVSFDVVDEWFTCKELPDIEEGDRLRERVLLAFGDSLGLLDVYSERNCIWVLEEGGESESWTKRCMIGLQTGRFLCPKQNGELLFATKTQGVLSYDINRQRRKRLAETCPHCIMYANVYVESLMLSKPINGELSLSFP